MLVIAGAIEGFFSPSPAVPELLKYITGIVLFILLTLYCNLKRPNEKLNQNVIQPRIWTIGSLELVFSFELQVAIDQLFFGKIGAFSDRATANRNFPGDLEGHNIKLLLQLAKEVYKQCWSVDLKEEMKEEMKDIEQNYRFEHLLSIK